jgi:hypothetical protein
LLVPDAGYVAAADAYAAYTLSRAAGTDPAGSGRAAEVGASDADALDALSRAARADATGTACATCATAQ